MPLRIYLAIFAALLNLPVYAAEWLSVQVPAPFEAGSSAPDFIRRECIGLERTVGVEVAYQLEKAGFAKVDRVELINQKAKGKQLALTITAANASIGKWTDPKSLSVKAELFNDGKSVEFTTVSYTSRDQHEVCDVLEKNAVTLAVDIHKWLMTTVHDKTLPAVLSSNAESMNAGTDQSASHAVWINNNIQYALDADSQQVITQCNLEESISSSALATFSKSLPAKRLKNPNESNANDDVLQFTIVDIKGDLDNAPQKRSLTIKVELLRGGAIIASFDTPRTTEKGGVFGQVMRNTCDALNNIAGLATTDTYQWYVKKSHATAP